MAVTPIGKIPSTKNTHVLRPVLDQGLGRHHVLDLAGADAEGERSEGAVGRRVTVAAHHGHAGQDETLFGSDDVDNALADIVHAVKLDAELGAILFQGFDLDARLLVIDAEVTVVCRDVVIGNGENRLGPAQFASVIAQTFEGLRARHLVHQVTVDIDDGRAVAVQGDNMGIPDLVEQGTRLGHGLRSTPSLRSSVPTI